MQLPEKKFFLGGGGPVESRGGGGGPNTYSGQFVLEKENLLKVHGARTPPPGSACDYSELLVVSFSDLPFYLCRWR